MDRGIEHINPYRHQTGYVQLSVYGLNGVSIYSNGRDVNTIYRFCTIAQEDGGGFPAIESMSHTRSNCCNHPRDTFHLFLPHTTQSMNYNQHFRYNARTEALLSLSRNYNHLCGVPSCELIPSFRPLPYGMIMRDAHKEISWKKSNVTPWSLCLFIRDASCRYVCASLGLYHTRKFKCDS